LGSIPVRTVGIFADMVDLKTLLSVRTIILDEITHIFVAQVLDDAGQPGLVFDHCRHVRGVHPEHGRRVAVASTPRDAVLRSTPVVVAWGR